MGKPSSVVSIDHQEYKIDEVIEVKGRENPESCLKIIKILKGENGLMSHYFGIKKSTKIEELLIQNVSSI